jgi:hypothetical protein
MLSRPSGPPVSSSVVSCTNDNVAGCSTSRVPVSRFLEFCRLHGDPGTVAWLRGLHGERLLPRLLRWSGCPVSSLLQCQPVQLLDMLRCLLGGLVYSQRSGRYDRLAFDLGEVLMAVLVPTSGDLHVDKSNLLWPSMVLVSCACALHTLLHAGDSGRFRVILRLLPERVQAHILFQQDARAWRRFVVRCLETCIVSSNSSTDGLLYLLIHQDTKLWYVGKTMVCRRYAGRLVPGLAMRFREHVRSCFRTQSFSAPRYKVWSHFAPSHLFCLPFFWGTSAEVDRLELTCIRYAQPPSQRLSAQATPSRAHAPRPWPRFRQRPNLASELDLNIWAKLRNFFKKWGSMGLWCCWTDATAWAKVNMALDPEALRVWMYCDGYESLLLVYIGERNHMLDWARVWRGSSTSAYVCGLWCLSGRFELQRRTRIREKLARFITSSGLIPSKCLHITIPIDDSFHIVQARRALRKSLGLLFPNRAYTEIQFLLSRIKLHKGKPESLQLLLQDHARVASSVDTAVLQSITPDDLLRARSMADARWLPYVVAYDGKATCDTFVTSVLDGITPLFAKADVQVDVLHL